MKRLLAAVLMTALVAAALPAVAGAGLLVQTTTDCSSPPLSQPFRPWLDFNDYTPVPGGGFESGSAVWSLSGGAMTVAGNESFRVGGAADARSLALPAGSSAVSPAMCVGIDHPTVRLFARRSGGSLLSTLRVDVLFQDASQTVQSLTIGLVSGSGTWQPSLPMLVVANLLPLLPGDMTPVAFRLAPQGTGTWYVDDVYVDPWSRR